MNVGVIPRGLGYPWQRPASPVGDARPLQRKPPAHPVTQVTDFLRTDLVGHGVAVPFDIEAQFAERLRTLLGMDQRNHRIARAVGHEHRLRSRRRDQHLSSRR